MTRMARSNRYSVAPQVIKDAFTYEEYAEFTALVASNSNIPRQNEILSNVLDRIQARA